MPDRKKVLIEIPNKSIGFISGDTVLVNLHVLGFSEQTGQVRFLVNDPLGATRQSLRDENRVLSEGHTVLPFAVEIHEDFPPGGYT